MIKEWVNKDNEFLYLEEIYTEADEKVIKESIKESITLDVSTMIYDYKCFDNFRNAKLIIPSVAIQELNVLKEQLGTERGYYARQILDFLDTLISIRGNGLKKGLIYGTNIISTHYISRLEKDSPLLDLVSINEDELIIETARITGSKLCTRDKEMRVIGSDFVTLYNYEFDIIPREIYKGYRYIPISLEDYSNSQSLYNQLITNGEVKGNLLNMNPWEFALFVDETSYKEFLNSKNVKRNNHKAHEKLQIIHTAVCRPKSNKDRNCDLVSVNLDENNIGYKISPKNQEQKMLMYLIKQMENKHIYLLTIQGGAGRGKTLHAVDFALKSVIKENQYTKMLYTKSIREIDKQEELGTVPGDEFEKFKNYVMPFYSAIEFIHRQDIHGQDTDERSAGRAQKNKGNGVTQKQQSLKTVDEIVENYRGTNKLIFLPLGKIRGMNLYNSFAMLDEGQNTTQHGMKSYISRLDNTSSSIVMGDNNQIDDPNLNERNNGFSHLIEKGKEEPFIAHLTLDIDKNAMRGLLATFASSKL